MPGLRAKGKRPAADWRKYYDKARATPDEAMKKIKRGDRIFIGTACGEPQALVKALIASQAGIEDAEIFNLLSLGLDVSSETEFGSAFRHNSFFIGPGARKAVWEGRADYIPIMMSEIPHLIRDGRIPIDVALIQVSPPDEHGFCTFGVSVDIVKSAAESAGLVIAQVNPKMPRTLGDCFIHVVDIDVIVEKDEPVLEWNYPEPNPVHEKVAENVAKLVQNGDTLEMGIGSIPNAVLSHLKDRSDLGVHTEVFSDGMLDLITAGAITCAKKTFHPGKIIASFCMGSRRLYDFIHNNPFFEFHPVEYCNNPMNIAKNDRLAAINVALEVDLTGQVNADSIGYHFYSGIGGQADFIRGAAMARRGKPVICLPSTAKDGKVSRIVAKLADGAGVVTTRGDVHYVVTEYGIAYLHGKNIRERAMALISIAHPDVRPELMAFAKDKKYVYADQLPPPASGVVYPEELERHFSGKKGADFFIRPLKITDEAWLRDMFYDLSEKSVYLRFFTPMKSLPHEKAQYMVNLDYQDQMAIGAFSGEDPDWKMAGIGQYILDRKRNMAEVAVMVLDTWQGQGLGEFLFNYMIRIAKQRGIEGFAAEVLAENRPMIHIMQNAGCKLSSKYEDGVYLFEMRFDQPAEIKPEGKDAKG
jgi:acyl-CoA hydrolase/GNAT superfamily N-acetyltransferase